MECFDGVCDELPFFRLVSRVEKLDVASPGGAGPEGLLLAIDVIGDNVVCRIEDIFR
jgi:hypothetical protein